APEPPAVTIGILRVFGAIGLNDLLALAVIQRIVLSLNRREAGNRHKSCHGDCDGLRCDQFHVSPQGMVEIWIDPNLPEICVGRVSLGGEATAALIGKVLFFTEHQYVSFGEKGPSHPGCFGSYSPSFARLARRDG